MKIRTVLGKKEESCSLRRTSESDLGEASKPLKSGARCTCESPKSFLQVIPARQQDQRSQRQRMKEKKKLTLPKLRPNLQEMGFLRRGSVALESLLLLQQLQREAAWLQSPRQLRQRIAPPEATCLQRGEIHNTSGEIPREQCPLKGSFCCWKQKPPSPSHSPAQTFPLRCRASYQTSRCPQGSGAR